VPVMHLHTPSRSLLLALDAGEVHLAHWGPPLGSDLPPTEVLVAPVPLSAHDVPVRLHLLPDAASGWTGQPALLGHRNGLAFSPRLRLISAEQDERGCARLVQHDPEVAISVSSDIELHDCGVLRIRHTVTNDGSSPYSVTQLAVTLGVPARARELLDVTGRWARERHPQRMPLNQGRWVRSERRGRTGHDSSSVLALGTPGFSFTRGEVWAVHLGWSSDHEVFAERRPSAETLIGGAEILGPGEVIRDTAASYQTPWLYAAYSETGLNGISDAFHGWMRARPHHPRTARPVMLNTWEAVYFRHDVDELKQLATAAADLGVERYVLDDGWFLNRRDDTSGLGDWTVDPRIWPDGLTPLIEHVHGLGLQFGLWVEPEMVNPDSDLARAHPDWVAGPGSHPPIPWRHQHVLDLSYPQAWQHVFDRLDALLSEHQIDYLKWDHNRDLAELGHLGRPSAHHQMLATYRLLDELRRKHPNVEIESCASGGARVDLAILERTDRIWASDTNDALERQTIQQWTQLLVPPELVGCHVGPPTAHTTGRTHSLGLRGITALFGHFGIEWDVRRIDPDTAAELREVIQLYRRHRSLVHSGRLVRADLPDPARSLYGVVAADGSAALFAYVALATSAEEMTGPIPLPGLDPELGYRVEIAYSGDSSTFLQVKAPAWTTRPTKATGRFLGEYGLPMPLLNPEKAILIQLTAEADSAADAEAGVS
jgi:alpha-galactosidase